MDFKDHFTGLGSAYQKFRPTYPEALFDWLAALVGGEAVVWDCATGNGQAAFGLANRVATVIATDGSADQIANANPHPNIDYRVATAEKSSLEESSVDMVTVAQALHWFDFPAFYREVARVVKPGGFIVAISHAFHSIDEGPIDAATRRLTHGILEKWWPPERALVNNSYRDIPFPYQRIETPAFAMSSEWTLTDMLGYLATSSARKRYLAAKGHDPIEDIQDALALAWGEPTRVRRLDWPLTVLAGRLP